ncbi:MAG TPA: hypothetical protein VGC80_14100 [Acetobacteraceae bacterium]|jgi:tetratricopeptide (TPR) repeat protein
MRLLTIIFLLAAVPALAQPRPDARRAELDNLLSALKLAPSEDAAAALEARIRQAWAQAGGPAAGLLLARGMRNLQNNAENDALDDFDAALVLEPDFAEAYRRRAMARFSLGDLRGAVADIQETLKREPRHFAAWQDLSRFAEARDDPSGALAAWQKALEIDPRAPDGQERLKMLRKKVLGEES